VSNLSEAEQLQIASGAEATTTIDIEKFLTAPMILGYGAPPISPRIISSTVIPKHHKISLGNDALNQDETSSTNTIGENESNIQPEITKPQL